MPARADDGDAERGSPLLSATYIIGGAMLTIANVPEIRDHGSLIGGLAGFALGASGLIYCNQAPNVRDETAIRITSVASLLTGAVSLGRYIRFVREQDKERVSLLVEPGFEGRVGLRILL